MAKKLTAFCLYAAAMLAALFFLAPCGPVLARTHLTGVFADAHAQMGSAIIYSDTADAKADIRAAIATAAREHKHVILDFGGNWCADCHLLNIYFHDPSNASLLQANYVLVDVSVGQYDKNLDIAKKYGIPLEKGVPALVILDGRGRVLYAQKNGEFEAMRKLDTSSVYAFLQKWKPRAHTATGKKPIAKSAGE
ncbi:MAG TPA: thioredoxin family protein [Acidobacteriaceae bacterium]|nr:thioredoxin family protein [Acidobacteriaceae bacterium]